MKQCEWCDADLIEGYVEMVTLEGRKTLCFDCSNREFLRKNSPTRDDALECENHGGKGRGKTCI